MPQYNQKQLQSYFDNRDWTGAAEYLSSIPASNPRKQAELNEQIRKLRRDGEIQNAMLQQMDKTQQDAYHFVSAINGSGNIPYKIDDNGEGNSFGITYTDLINNTRVQNNVMSPGKRNLKGEQINRIRVELNNNEAYDNYLDALETNVDEISTLGVRVSKDNKTGKTIVDIPTSNPKLYNFIIKTRELNKVFDVSPLIPGGSGHQVYITDNFAIKGITSSNIVVDKSQFNYDNITRAARIVDDAISLDKKTKDRLKNISIDEQLYITPYLGYGDANAYKMYKNGVIDTDAYTKIRKERKDAYNTILRGIDLTKHEVFLDEKQDDGNRLTKVDNKDINLLKESILLAMDDDRITYQAAMLNDEVGTLITLTPKIDKEGKPYDNDYSKTRTIFVKNLFKSSCEASFRNDTKQMAVRDNADMRRWNYGKTLHDGNYVGYNKNIGAYRLDKATQQKIPIDESTMLSLLNKENIIDNTVNKLLINLEEDGTIITRSNGKKVTNSVESMASMYAASATNELYPAGYYTEGERLRYQNDIYQTIIKLLGNRLYNTSQND